MIFPGLNNFESCLKNYHVSSISDQLLPEQQMRFENTKIPYTFVKIVTVL
jgi:hypothetical protein